MYDFGQTEGGERKRKFRHVLEFLRDYCKKKLQKRGKRAFFKLVDIAMWLSLTSQEGRECYICKNAKEFTYVPISLSADPPTCHRYQCYETFFLNEEADYRYR